MNRGTHGIFLGNGVIGTSFAASGGSDKDSAVFVAGSYDAKENLAHFPLWHDLGLPAPKPGDKYEQTLDMKRGILTTKMGDVTVTAFATESEGYAALVNVKGAKPSSPPDQSTFPPSFHVQARTEADGSVTRFCWAGSYPYQAGATLANLQSAHEAAWQKLWQDADIQIDGDPEAQQLVHKLMFDLLQSTHPGASDSIPPETISGDFYKGHIFWDAEVWMFPALLAQHPDYARSILDYRFKHLAEAKAIAKSEGFAGADFPWESAASGKEVAPGEFSKERHITADIGWAAWQYWLATGDKDWLKTRGWPVISAVAEYWASRAKKNAQTGKFDIDGVVGPDELKGVVDNNTYTNAMVRSCLLSATAAAKIVGQPADPKWQSVADGVALPFDKAGGYYLARQNDEGKPTKQADGELVIYPAALPMDAKTAGATFDFEAKRPIKNGPAMTDSIHALIAARLGRASQAETYFRDSYRPFVRGPFLLFSEKRSLDRCVFTTGAGGVLQAVIYGFGGLDFSQPSGIVPGKPALPPSWKKLTITGIQRGGKRYTLTVTPEGRTLTPA